MTGEFEQINEQFNSICLAVVSDVGRRCHYHLSLFVETGRVTRRHEGAAGVLRSSLSYDESSSYHVWKSLLSS